MKSPDHKRATYREPVILATVGGENWFYFIHVPKWNFGKPSIINIQERLYTELLMERIHL